MSKKVEAKYITSHIAKAYCSNCKKYTKVEQMEMVYTTRTEKHANFSAFLLLTLLGLIPGIIYLTYHLVNKYEVTELKRKQWCCSCCGLPDYIESKQQWCTNDETLISMTEEEMKENTVVVSNWKIDRQKKKAAKEAKKQNKTS